MWSFIGVVIILLLILGRITCTSCPKKKRWLCYGGDKDCDQNGSVHDSWG